ncbi:MAG: exopolysaccharide biosynthesis polyprenyl glycosylphosphotransferase [Clostridiales bacterium]|nr:exopolysaccharide biosynthesis polyprenyl glycosylphosphotransferase [Clostridiales bacterium]
MKDKRYTTFATLLLFIVNVGLFAFVWRAYYNAYAFRSHRPEGFVGAMLVYALLYRWLSKLYRGYAFASTSVGDTVLSQFISFGLADLVMYAAVCLIRRQYVNIVPGAIIVALQLVGTTVIVLIVKRILYLVITPTPTMLVYGGPEDRARAKRFIGRLRSHYGHLFVFPKVVHESREADVLAGIRDCEAVMFVDTSTQRRDAFIEACMAEHKPFYFVPEFVDIIQRGCTVKNFLDTPLMRYDYAMEHQRGGVGKRAFDLVVSVVVLAVLSPFMLLSAIAVKAEDGGPVFFRQKRVTKDGREFTMLKFRSMVVDAERMGVTPATAGDPRVTRVGRVLRKTRLDETPQLLNVLKGDMSVVGPRPERTEHVALYEAQLPQFRYRLAVKGGLTGYAQVYGKYNTSPEDKLKLDLIYIENQSMILDFKLLLLTFKTVFQPERAEGFNDDVSARIRRDASGKGGA